MAEDTKKVAVHARSSAGGASEEAYLPLVDVYDEPEGSGTVLVAEIPGATHEGTEIRVDKGVLTILAEAGGPQRDDEYLRTYTGFVRGQYFRAFALSDEVDRDKIEASLEDGVLTIRLPRAEQARTKKIKIKSK